MVGPFSGRLTLVDLFGLENQKTGGCKTDSWLKPLTNKSLMNDRVVIHEMAKEDIRRNAQWWADNPYRVQAEKWFHHGLSPKGTSVNSQGCKPLETVELVT